MTCLMVALTPNFNTMISSGAFALKEKFHGETFLFLLTIMLKISLFAILQSNVSQFRCHFTIPFKILCPIR